MELTLGDMAVIIDALTARLKFQNRSDSIGPWNFNKETYKSLLDKLYDSRLVFAVEVVDDKEKERKG